jgi:hypothetical protein
MAQAPLQWAAERTARQGDHHSPHRSQRGSLRQAGVRQHAGTAVQRTCESGGWIAPIVPHPRACARPRAPRRPTGSTVTVLHPEPCPSSNPSNQSNKHPSFYPPPPSASRARFHGSPSLAAPLRRSATRCDFVSPRSTVLIRHRVLRRLNVPTTHPHDASI